MYGKPGMLTVKPFAECFAVVALVKVAVVTIMAPGRRLFFFFAECRGYTWQSVAKCSTEGARQRALYHQNRRRVLYAMGGTRRSAGFP